MQAVEIFDRALTRSERRAVGRLTSPSRIQRFLDELAYGTDKTYRCPLRVLRERTGHCFDGALFAAAVLRRLGHPPLILDMLPSRRDDDHVVALFKRYGHWGAVANSNFVGLRFREPIYRTLREVVLSYFEQYFNVALEKTLRGYTRPLNLRAHTRITSHFLIPASRRLRPIFPREVLKITGYSCGFARSDQPNSTKIRARTPRSYFCVSLKGV
jgi:hypothetical protein